MSKVVEDSSDFHDFWTELIVTKKSIVWDTLCFFQFFSRGRSARRVFSRGRSACRLWKFKINVNQNENESRNTSGGTCEGGAKRSPRRSLHQFRFCFRFNFRCFKFWFSEIFLSTKMFNLVDAVPCSRNLLCTTGGSHQVPVGFPLGSHQRSALGVCTKVGSWLWPRI